MKKFLIKIDLFGNEIHFIIRIPSDTPIEEREQVIRNKIFSEILTFTEIKEVTKQ